MEEALEKGKESSQSALANEWMNEWNFRMVQVFLTLYTTSISVCYTYSGLEKSNTV